ncbi:MAG: hypothetical protein ACYTEW_13145 [Planctomycetota bacterium]|jgi:hypothetical protein
MKAGRIKKSLCLLCLFLATAAIAQSDTSSVLDRVQKVDDPELAELLRLAIERWDGRKTDSEITRKVTLSYTQIKLLDLQIQEVSRKAESQTGPAEMRYELLLAKAELESKLMVELANLREIMGITPRLPFAEQPIETLNAHISLQVIGERVYVLEGQKPFEAWWAMRRWKSVGLLSEKKTLDYVRGRLKDKNSLPIRFKVNYNPETKGASEDLRSKIISMAKETNSQIDTEVRLITMFHARILQRPDGGPELLATGLVNPNDLEQHILWRLTKPKNVPLTFRIEYDEASALVAKLVADTAKDVVKRLGIAEIAGVESVLVEPIPETVFLGRWRGTSRGDFQSIDVQPNGLCQVTIGDRHSVGRPTTRGLIKAGASVSGTWLLTTKNIYIDINDRRLPEGGKYVYWGYLDKEGNLIIDRGMIYCQGSFHGSGSRTILKKVY